MREEILKQFFLGQINADSLWRDVRGSEIIRSDLVSEIQIEDMKDPFHLTASHLIVLCDAIIGRSLTPDVLMPIGFALMASDVFEWEDDVMSEVIADWSCPEINYPLTVANTERWKRWLNGTEQPPTRLPSSKSIGRLISVTKKISPGHKT